MVLPHPGGQQGAHVAAAHVWRVRCNHRVGTGQVLRLIHHPLGANVQIRDVQGVGDERRQSLLRVGQSSGVGDNEGAQYIGVNETLPEVPARLSTSFRAGKLVELGCVELHRPDHPDMRLHGAA